MITSLFWGLLFFGALLGGFLGGFNWGHVKGSDRDQTVVRNRIILGVVAGVIVFGTIGFFLH